MKQFGKEMFDFCGVKAVYASKYGHQKTDRQMVGLFSALLQRRRLQLVIKYIASYS